MEVVRFREAESYEPAGHHGVINRLLAGRGQGGIEAVSIWHGLLAPGAGASPHVHEHSVQIYVTITGMLEVSNGLRSVVLTPGDTSIIAPGEVHDIHNRGDTDATVLVISAPSLR